MTCFARSLAVSSLMLLAALVIAPAAHAQAGSSDNAEYERIVHQALQEYQMGNYSEMFAAMHRAHEIEPNARTLRGMGVAAFELKNYVLALVNLRAALIDSRKPLTAAMITETRDEVKRAELYVDTLTVTLEPQGADLTIDGEAPTRDQDGKLMVSLGKHDVRATLSGYVPEQRSVTAVGGEKHELSITLSLDRPAAAEPQAPLAANSGGSGNSAHVAATTSAAHDSAGISQTTWGLIAFGGAAAFAIGSGVSFAVRQSAVDHYNSKACAPDRSKQCPDYADRASLTRALGIISAATAGALIVTGVVLIVTDHDAEPSDETASATRCGIGPLGVSCAGSF